jgi:subtilisin family serine protease
MFRSIIKNPLVILSLSALVMLTFAVDIGAEAGRENRARESRPVRVISRPTNIIVTTGAQTLDQDIEEYAKVNGQLLDNILKGKIDSGNNQLPPMFESRNKNARARVASSLNMAAEEIKQSRFNSRITLTVSNARQIEQIEEMGYKVEIDQVHFPLLENTNKVINTPVSWALGDAGAGKGQYVVVMDNGTDVKHPFFAGKNIIESCFSTNNSMVRAVSLCPNRAETMTGTGSARPCSNQPSCDHGNHVAGIAVGKGANSTNNFHGVAREGGLIAIQVFSTVNNPTICSGGVLSCNVSFSSDQAEAMDFVAILETRLRATNSPLSIGAVNLSVGGGSQSSQFCDNNSFKSKIDLLKSRNIATVVAAGNNGNFGISSPACISSAISVGATTNTDTIASFSNRHPNLDIVAPGAVVRSSSLNNNYSLKAGTSMATPMVAGAMAILKARFPSNSVDDNLKILQDTGVNVNYSHLGKAYTTKRLRMCRQYVRNNTVWECR